MRQEEEELSRHAAEIDPLLPLERDHQSLLELSLGVLHDFGERVFEQVRPAHDHAQISSSHIGPQRWLRAEVHLENCDDPSSAREDERRPAGTDQFATEVSFALIAVGLKRRHARIVPRGCLRLFEANQCPPQSMFRQNEDDTGATNVVIDKVSTAPRILQSFPARRERSKFIVRRDRLARSRRSSGAVSRLDTS